jgi:hypothetical protein
MLADSLQDVDQVGVRIDFMQSAGDDQALDDADLFGAEFGPAEQPGFSPHWNDPERALEMIGIDRDIRIGEEYLKPESASFRIDQRFDERVRGREPLAFALALCGARQNQSGFTRPK